MPVVVTPKRFNDFEALQDLVSDNKSDVIQLGRGKMSGKLTHIHVDPGFSISTGEFSLSARATGVLSTTRFALGYLLRTRGPAVGHHHEFGAGDLAIAAPGEDRYMRFTDESEYFAAQIDPDQLRIFLEKNAPGAFDVMLRYKLSILHAPPATARANIQILRPILMALSDPDISDDAAAFAKRNIMELLTAPFRETANHHFHNARWIRQDALVREVDRFYDRAGDRPVHITEICELFRVDRQALHRAFHEVTGISPIRFARIKRLNHAHTALRRDGRGITVGGVARDLGFFVEGRFSGEYRQQFGEYPSDTLRRSIHRIAD